MKVTIKKVRNSNFDRRVKKAIKADEQWVKSGHYADQGEHYSGMTYPELLAFWHVNPFAPKKILLLTYYTLHDLSTKQVSAIRNRWIKDLDTKFMLKSLGSYMKETEYKFFGKTVPGFIAPDADGTPLVETGELQEKTEYRTSMGDKG